MTLDQSFQLKNISLHCCSLFICFSPNLSHYSKKNNFYFTPSYSTSHLIIIIIIIKILNSPHHLLFEPHHDHFTFSLCFAVFSHISQSQQNKTGYYALNSLLPICFFGQFNGHWHLTTFGTQQFFFAYKNKYIYFTSREVWPWLVHKTRYVLT